MLGKFLNKDVKFCSDLIDVAQDYKILDIVDVGKTTKKVVSVIQMDNGNGRKYLTGVTRGYYDMMDFSDDKHLKAYNNFSKDVRRVTGAYSNKYKTK